MANSLKVTCLDCAQVNRVPPRQAGQWGEVRHLRGAVDPQQGSGGGFRDAAKGGAQR